MKKTKFYNSLDKFLDKLEKKDSFNTFELIVSELIVMGICFGTMCLLALIYSLFV